LHDALPIWEQQSAGKTDAAAPVANAAVAEARPVGTPDEMIKWVLFSTGFVAMAMEVVWTRAFTPVLKTQVYSFAMIVFAYLGATFLGSWLYRRDLRGNRQMSKAALIAALAGVGLFPVVAKNPRIL